MDSVWQSLIEHKNECYYEGNVNEIIKNCESLHASKRFKMETNNVYNTAIKYIKKWFNFNDHKYKILFHLSLLNIPKDIVEITNVFTITLQ